MKAGLATRLLAVAAGGLLLGTPQAHAVSISHTCTYHSDWPTRHYDCTGTAIEYTHYCSAHWTDDDSDGSWVDYNSRVISVSCTGSTGTYTCTEDAFASSWNCSGTGTEGPGTYCSSYSWHDDDPDPYFDSGAYYTGPNSCVNP